MRKKCFIPNNAQMTFKSLVNFGNFEKAPVWDVPVERYHSTGGGHGHGG